ncbi:3-oxoacyl-[acyl-carrier-protein] synthase, mitochondrial [Batrachochytrium dendrobatidis JEL423]|uniref:beta-ketoacyl-[acyl-carrier-protein] synthase I n=1 Tax=Batrachochytrium dendrobatidis (strain JEL423) TaxID=403673 RepID=A0A177W9A5_BATDL|nr:3-oxoacyl-[acyl-carrier-protein] synthase, mitochondrial [Batrachochytrium dendrobatidis JEL423]
MARRRVVVTGLGLVTPLGCDVSHVWSRLLSGDSGIVSLAGRTHLPTGLTYADISSQVAALVPTDPTIPYSFNASAEFSKNDEKKMPPFILYARYAASRALKDAAWIPSTNQDQERTARMGCIDDTVNLGQVMVTHGIRKVSPYLVPRLLINMASGHISIEHKLKGPNHSVSTACATGAHAIGDAMRFIQYGDADVMVAGGTESAISPISMAGFAKAKSLSTKYNNKPIEASRPFDRDRDGFVMGEGAGVVVLEEMDHAVKRGAKIYAELSGYGLSGDAHHMTAPPENAHGAARAMQIGDLAETRAIRDVLGQNVAVSSTKGAIGHLLGAAGSVEAIFTILSLHTNMIPPTLNLHNLEPKSEFCLDYVANKARDTNKLMQRSGTVLDLVAQMQVYALKNGYKRGTQLSIRVRSNSATPSETI